MDKWVKTNDKDTFQMARRLIKEEGLLCGKTWGKLPLHMGIIHSTLLCSRWKQWSCRHCCIEGGKGAESGPEVCGHSARLHQELHD